MKLQRLNARFLEKVWGSTRLEPWFPSTGKAVGEVWFEGAEPLPLLVKFLFTSAKLSVQVHPDDDYAALHHHCAGKTEMWHVLAEEPGAQIAAGFRESLSAARLREAAESGEIEQLLEWYDAAPGDTFFIPAGTVHAIGAGLVLCEIQQVSDVTYRLYDYGRPRELHLDHALAVSRRERHAARPQPRGDELVSCSHFTTWRFCIKGAAEVSGEFQLLIVTEGGGEIEGRPVRAGEVWRVWSGQSPVRISGDLTVLATLGKKQSPGGNG